jgi:hypothetical protein
MTGFAEAIQKCSKKLDCLVALLLAMTTLAAFRSYSKMLYIG